MASFPSWFLGEGASIQDAKTVQLLIDLGQEHLLGTPSPAGTDDSSVDAETLAARRTLLEQVRALDAKYPGGLEAYVVKSRKLLHEARTGINPFIKLKPAQPECEALPFAGKAFLEAEARGLQEASSACFVLVAGGLGERLGYSGIKLALPTETCTMTCFLELFARNLLAIQRHANTASTDARPSSPFDNASEPPTKKARDNQSNKSVGIPLLIMTSNDTHERTQELLEANNYFGLDPAQVDLLMQDKVASIQDVEGRFAVDLSEPSKCPPILTKPHGHGDVHLLLHQSGIARKWLGEGKRWVVFFQDTNANVFRTLIPGIGVSAGRGFDGNFVAVPRKAKSASGAIMRLSDPSRDTTTTNNNSNDSKPAGTLNVEYNYVDDVLRAHGYPDGDVNVPGDGGDYSAFPGNTNQLVISLDVYVPVLEGSSGLIPEFVNPKYSDSDKREFKPTRLECMMQDIFQLLPHSSKVGVTVFEDSPEERTLTHRLYCPVKNNLQDAAKKATSGVPSGSAISGELAVYAANACALRALGASIESPVPCMLGGIEDKAWPRIVFMPSFALGFGQLRTRCFKDMNSVKITARSTLVVEGDVVFEDLDLDGTLVVHCVVGARVVVKNAVIRNQGWEMKSLLDGQQGDQSQHLDEVYKIRGCYTAKQGRDICHISVSTPGDHVIELPLAADAASTDIGAAAGGGGGAAL